MKFANETLSIYHDYYKMHDFEFDTCPCRVVEPEKSLPGNPWVWKAEFFDAFPTFEIEMLQRGYHLCFMSVGNTFGCPDAMKHFNHFYRFLTGEGFSRRPVLLGLSRGGLYIYNWACANPDKVRALYADNPVCDFKSWPGGKGCGPGSPEDWAKLLQDYHFASEAEALAYRQNPVDKVKILVDAKVPLVHAAGEDDEVVPIAENTDVMAQRIAAAGGKLKVFRHPGRHHPHGLSNPKPLADWIESHRIQ